jgi:hypothetical protein
VDDYARAVTYLHARGGEEALLQRLRDEMNNRRQYGSFVASFEEEVPKRQQPPRALARTRRAKMWHMRATFLG